VKLAWERLELRTELPFRISRSTRRRVTRVWVRIEHEGVEGWGEAAPVAYYGESAASVEAALEEMRPILAATGDPEALEALERRLEERVPGAASARAAVSAALHDLVGKRLGRPLWRLLGLDPAACPPSSFTLGLDDPARLEERARALRRFPALKLKLGAEGDPERVRAVRAAAPETALRVDANAAWTLERALEMLPVLGECGVELLEQPLPPEDRTGYRELSGRSSIPIFVDESCRVAADVPDLADRVDGVSLKLAKCGSVREALRAIHVARACGLGVMLGCMLESTLGIAPAAHLAPLVDHADLDGAELLAGGDDPFTGPRLERGRVVLEHAPGLGVGIRA